MGSVPCRDLKECKKASKLFLQFHPSLHSTRYPNSCLANWIVWQQWGEEMGEAILFSQHRFFSQGPISLCEIISCISQQHKQTKEQHNKQATEGSRGHGSGSFQTQQQFTNKLYRRNRERERDNPQERHRQASSPSLVLLLAVSCIGNKSRTIRTCQVCSVIWRYLIAGRPHQFWPIFSFGRWRFHFIQ